MATIIKFTEIAVYDLYLQTCESHSVENSSSRMASDLKIEIFASQFFETYWKRAGFLSHQLEVSSLYPEEYYLDPENATLCGGSHLMAVFVKHFFYHFAFVEEFPNFFNNFEPSASYLLNYISRTCARDGLFAGQSIFELLFSSCALVVHLSFFCFKSYGYRDVLSYVHLCWAMYFDEYKEEFYRQGGWSQLKIVSYSYILQYEILCNLTNKGFNSLENVREYIYDVMSAVDNYKTFLSGVQDNCKTVSKAWLKFHLQKIYKSDASDISKDMIKAQVMRYPKVVEKFLLQFRILCNPNCSEALNIKAQTKYNDTEKQSFEKQSLSKLNNLALNNMTQNTTSEPDSKQKEQDLQEPDGQINKLIPIELSLGKGNDDQADAPTTIDFSQCKDTTSDKSENHTREKDSFLKLEMASSVDFSEKKTTTASEPKLKEQKKEIDLEEENPEVKCLLRMILVLGNPSGIIRVGSSLPPSDTHQRKKKS